MKSIFAALLLAACASSAIALDEPEAKVKFSDEKVLCASYYTIVEEALEEAGKDAEAKQMAELADKLLVDSVVMTGDKFVKARFNLHRMNMMEEVGLSHENFADLIGKYGETCKETVKDPEARMEYWRGK